jgi:hypothetical protein
MQRLNRSGSLSFASLGALAKAEGEGRGGEEAAVANPSSPEAPYYFELRKRTWLISLERSRFGNF